MRRFMFDRVGIVKIYWAKMLWKYMRVVFFDQHS